MGLRKKEETTEQLLCIPSNVVKRGPSEKIKLLDSVVHHIRQTRTSLRISLPTHCMQNRPKVRNLLAERASNAK